jgi:hypothetical protein
VVERVERKTNAADKIIVAVEGVVVLEGRQETGFG